VICPDANTVIHYLKGRQPVVSRWLATPPTDLAIPSVVVYVIEFGTLKIGTHHRRGAVSGLLHNLLQIPFDDDAARSAARIRFGLESRGLTIGPLDLLIAGTALSRNAVLVTNNTREFSRVEGLKLVDWTK
jgi:tRNA(fMet)-specific endonuclease VapC